jgi:hypothetical protein
MVSKQPRLTITAALAAIMAAAAMAGSAVAASDPVDVSENASRPFAGVYAGTAYGDKGTAAPLYLTMTQDGSDIAATATLGEGLYVATPRCGGGEVPAGSAAGIGQVDPLNASRVRTEAAFAVQGIPVIMVILGDLSEDAQSLTAHTTLDLPSLCGADPTLTGTLERIG